MIFRTFAIAALLALGSAPQNAPAPELVGRATVRGVVKDIRGGTIEKAILRFESEDYEVVAKTLPDGTYEAKFPPGIYSLRVTATGFCAGLRGEFTARDGSDINFDFTLIAGTIVDIWPIDHDATAISPQNVPGCPASEELSVPIKNGPKPLVLYEKRVAQGDSIDYSGSDDGAATYTYDLLTVHATDVLYSPTDHSVVGTGSVTWDDGKNSGYGTHIRVSYHDGQANLDPAK